ncbi:hypothetical protein NKH52_31000 [Mesorhizobium sp. M1066]|uniref:Uncharacterized protein n=1 Tax=Mesorhizobium opportunistum TaxID=593909 RepID=A0ABV1YB38_9HYPH|nr:hypothetical protein [Mesorhizobium sp. L2C084A000]ESZ30606.1 hypothetical protein X734_04265 [Mesorhizobium sp. L2C084A000]
MTAEIAILNKSAVALAADSAVTISAGDVEEKTYDSAEKLFDLSHRDPIGVMIYNGMQFMQAPLQILISDYRRDCKSFPRLQDAALDFLTYLNAWGNDASAKVQTAAVESILMPLIRQINERITTRLERLLKDFKKSMHLETELNRIVDLVLATFEQIYRRVKPARFIGGSAPRITKGREAQIREIVEQNFMRADDRGFTDRVVALAKRAVLSETRTGSQTGIVIAGFGSRDLFPSLISFEIDGVVFGKLKYARTNFVDIDRDGERSRVLPFAQREMVERFLYGLDEGIERHITTFVNNTISSISKDIIAQLDMPEAERRLLIRQAGEAETAFNKRLREEEFEEIRSQSRKEIEDMVEFMPKSELASMAEALVNLTSLKRHVSRGMQTVGGPIDVAVISRADGFIWVKRKHYFEPELNLRYVHRVRSNLMMTESRDDEA